MTFSPEQFSTTAVRGGLVPDPATGAVVTPIYQSTTYHQEAVGVHKGFTYSRAANPTVSALEAALGALEDTPPAVCFSTGMAAISTLFLATLKSGDHVVVSDVVYGGTVRLFQQVLGNFGVESAFVDTSDPAAVADAIKPNTKLVFIETPANPTLKLTDIAAIAKVAHAAGVKLAVDNTFLTPVLQRPLELGADITLLSTTKYIEGHNSTVGGSIATRDERPAGALALGAQDARLHPVSPGVVADAARAEDASVAAATALSQCPEGRRMAGAASQSRSGALPRSREFSAVRSRRKTTITARWNAGL